MVAIHFQSQEETEFLHSLLQRQQGSLFRIEKKPLQLAIEINEEKKAAAFEFLHFALKKLITEKKRVEWWIQILEDEFFYSDMEEQQQIIEMIYSILDGKRKDLSVELEYWRDDHDLDEAIKDVLTTSQSLSFEAFITFRLRSYIEKISSLIEIAIDEYKLEQDYQMFIHYLRKFIKDRAAGVKQVHLVNNDGFIFFDENKQEIRRGDLNKKIDRKLLSNHPIYVDSTTIAPLISMNPEEIYLYTDVVDQGIIHTLKQVFEERIHIYPLEEFQSKRLSEK